jgi:hypothetical protein
MVDLTTVRIDDSPGLAPVEQIPSQGVTPEDSPNVSDYYSLFPHFKLPVNSIRKLR